MNRMQLRLKPKVSLLDLDLAVITRQIETMAGLKDFQLFDDRASDATFVTLVIHFTDSKEKILPRIKAALDPLVMITPYIVDDAGECKPLDSIEPTTAAEK